VSLLDIVFHPEITVGDCVEILQHLSDRGVTAFVAGGWLRDKDQGLSPKDLDIFILNPGGRCIKNIRVGDAILGSHDLFPNYPESPMRSDVEYVMKYPNHDIDFIVMHSQTIHDVIEHFDLSICQIWGVLVDGHIDVYASKHYNEWNNNKIIYRYTDIPTCDAHLNRVKRKFGVEFTKVVSGDFEAVKIGELNV